MNKYFVLSFAAILTLAACGGGAKSRVKKGDIQQTMDQDVVQKKYIEAIGICGANQEDQTQTQRRANSRDCAIEKARFEMLSMVKGIELEGGVRVEDSIAAGSVIQSKLNDTIKGLEPVKTEWTNDDGCVITMRLPKQRLEEMMGVKFK